MKLPSFIYIGTGKVATTWLFSVLSKHPDVFITPVKETNFFDLNYHRGIDWYSSFFEAAGNSEAIGEISHRYVHNAETATRIRKHLGQIKIIIGLREPRDYCISDYLFTKRNGRFSGTLDEWCESKFDWETIAYRTMIEPFISEFGKDQIFLYRFDELSSDPQGLLNRITDHIGVGRYVLALEDLSPVNSASKSRNAAVANLVNRASKFVKRRGGQRLIAAIKYNPMVQRVLYKSIDQKPRLSELWSERIIAYAESHLEWLDLEMDVQISQAWGIKE